MVNLVPVDHDPFADDTTSNLVAVDNNPFAAEPGQEIAAGIPQNYPEFDAAGRQYFDKNAPVVNPERPGGRKVLVTGPQTGGQTRAVYAYDPSAAQMLDNLNNGARAFANAATLNQADKVAAKGEELTGDGDYETNLANERAKSAAVPESVAIPSAILGTIAGPGKVVGAVANKLIPLAEGASGLPAVLRRYANYATQGGTLNALVAPTEDQAKQDAAAATGAAGVGMVAPEGGSSIFGATAKNFAKGVPMAVIPPALIEGAPAAARTVLSPILSRLDPEDAFFSKLGQAVDRSGWSPEQLLAKTSRLGPDAFFANAGGAVTDFAKGMAQFPDRFRQSAQSAFRLQQGGRMATSGGTVGRVEDAINRTMLPEAPEMIQKATQVTDASTPAQQQAASASIAAISDPSAANYARALTAVKTAESKPFWDKIDAENPVVYNDKIGRMIENPNIKAGLKVALDTERTYADANGIDFDPGQYAITGFNSAGDPIMSKTPTFKGLQTAKKGLDSLLFGAAPSGEKDAIVNMSGQLTDRGRSIAALRRSLLNEMDGLVPDYAKARATFAGPEQAQNMIELGQKAAKGDVRVTADIYNDLTPSEKDFFRVGQADQLKYLVSKTNDGSSVVKGIFGNQNARRNLELTYPNKQQFNRLRSSLASEEQKFSTKNAILGGSQTSANQQAAGDSEQDLGQAVLEGAAKHGATGAAATVIDRALNYLRAPPEAVRDVGSRVMFEKNPGLQRSFIDELLRRQANTYAAPGAGVVPQAGVVGSQYLPQFFRF